MRRTSIIAMLVVLLAGCYAADPGRTAAGGGPATLGGAPAQSFTLARTDGRSDSLGAHRGRVVLMNLWASWCPPCRQEMPDLERFARAYRGRVDVLGVDEGESASVAARFAQQTGVTFPILVDESQQYGRTYEGLGLPTSVIVARDGRVVRGIDGAMTIEQMRAAVAPALAAAPR